MCQIPELRSVDAQILVACGIVTPEALSERRPEQVLSSVQPLADSAEGQKLLKTAGQPDLATVTASSGQPMLARFVQPEPSAGRMWPEV